MRTGTEEKIAFGRDKKEQAKGISVVLMEKDMVENKKDAQRFFTVRWYCTSSFMDKDCLVLVCSLCETLRTSHCYFGYLMVCMFTNAYYLSKPFVPYQCAPSRQVAPSSGCGGRLRGLTCWV